MKLQEEYTKNNATYTVIKIDNTDNATYITVKDKNGNTLAYGKKAFKEKYIKKGS